MYSKKLRVFLLVVTVLVLITGISAAAAADISNNQNTTVDSSAVTSTSSNSLVSADVSNAVASDTSNIATSDGSSSDVSTTDGSSSNVVTSDISSSDITSGVSDTNDVSTAIKTQLKTTKKTDPQTVNNQNNIKSVSNNNKSVTTSNVVLTSLNKASTNDVISTDSKAVITSNVNSQNVVKKSSNLVVDESTYSIYFGTDGSTTSQIAAGDTVTLNGTFTNKTFNVDKTGMTLTSYQNGILQNTHITVTAANTIVSNLNINTTGYTEAISVSANNVTLSNNNIELTNGISTISNITYGIVTTGDNTNIVDNNVYVAGPALSIVWNGGSGSIANTIGIYSQAVNVYIAGNMITVINSTVTNSTVQPYSTIEGIEVRGDNNTVVSNQIAVSGARDLYVIDSLAKIGNLSIINNVLYGNGERYVAGMQLGGGLYNATVSSNVIKLNCFNSTVYTGSDEAMIFGIVLSSMTGTGVNNVTINNNLMDLSSTIVYGIEDYQNDNINIFNNQINAVGTAYAMGMDIAYGTNTTVKGNIIITSGNSSVKTNPIVEDIQPANVGISLSNGTANAKVTNNTIKVTNVGTGITRGIVNQCANGAMISSNEVTVYGPADPINFGTSTDPLTQVENSVVDTEGIINLLGNNVQIKNNNVKVISNNDQTYGSIEGIEVRGTQKSDSASSNNIVSGNIVSVKSGEYVYGINVNNNVYNLTINNNEVKTVSQIYANDIQLCNGVYNANISGNELKATSFNSNTSLNTSLTYGIILTSFNTTTLTVSNTTINNNEIKLSSAIGYGIEAFKTNTTRISNNFIHINAAEALSVVVYQSKYTSIYLNTIKTIGNSSVNVGTIDEVIKPLNVGISIMGNSTNTIINNNDVLVTNNGNSGITRGIFTNNTSNNVINNNNVVVYGPADTIIFVNNEGVADTIAIFNRNGDNTTIANNVVVANTTNGNSSLFGTISGIGVRQSNDVNITNNIVTVTGGNYAYGINVIYNVTNVRVTNNKVTTTGPKYSAGIQVTDNVKNSYIVSNTIIALDNLSTNDTTISYGIIVSTMNDQVSSNSTIAKNTINLKSLVNYGIEAYKLDNTKIMYNEITAIGAYSTGIALDTCENSTIKTNVINTIGNSSIAIASITEDIAPSNVGILVQNGTTNSNIYSNTVSVTNVGNGITNGIASYKSDSTVIKYNKVTVNGPANNIDWTVTNDRLGLANTVGIINYEGNDGVISSNSVTVTSTNGDSDKMGTITGITVRGPSSNVKVYVNNVTVTGGRFVYGINALYNLTNVKITHNIVTTYGDRYTDGIQIGDGVKTGLVSGNIITGVCHNSTVYTGDDEAMAFGIIGTSYNQANRSNKVSIVNNTITLDSTINYGIEDYKTSNTQLSNNTIKATGLYSMGISVAYGINNTVRGNKIITVGNSSVPINYIVEEIRPANTGIAVVNGSINTRVADNVIFVTNVCNGTTEGIYSADSTKTLINNNFVTVNGPANDIDWTSGSDIRFSLANTQGILNINGNEAIIADNTVIVQSTNGDTDAFGTITGIGERNANNTKIRANNVTVTGGRFVYGINTLEGINHLIINNNTINSISDRYTDGIQIGNGINNVMIAFNNITGICHNNTVYTVNDEAMSFGIITSTMGAVYNATGIPANNVTMKSNNITLSSTITYGIENFKSTNIIEKYNYIVAIGAYSMGTSFDNVINASAYGNKIVTIGNSAITINPIVEDISPANVGILAIKGTNTLSIYNNKIVTKDLAKNSTAYSVKVNGTSNIKVITNKLTGNKLTGDKAVDNVDSTNIIISGNKAA